MDKISKRLEGGLFFGVKCNRLLEHWKGTIMDKRFLKDGVIIVFVNLPLVRLQL